MQAPLVRPALAYPLVAALALGAVSNAHAQATPPASDPIATELAHPSQPAAAPAPPADQKPAERVFSPAAISDILAHEATEPPPAAPAPASTHGTAPTPRAPAPAAVNAMHFEPVAGNSKTVDPVVLKAEILLDRAHAPPGVIDGRLGSNVTKAIAVFETTHGLPVDGKLTRAVWDALGGDSAAPVLVSYKITAEDVAGPFYPDLPSNYALLAKLPTAGYHDAAELLGERFHMDKRFLQALNPGVDFGVAGSTITVADVESLPLVSRIARIDVDKAKGQVQAYDAQGNLIVAYPATIGSEELPSPSGSYTVKGVAWHPVYSYDPKKNFQQGANTERLTLPAGPNNPVGIVFIALSKPTYGIHGTPDPSKIDKTHSHGCVRLTNWNALELAHLVHFGVPVNFIDPPAEASEAASTSTAAK